MIWLLIAGIVGMTLMFWLGVQFGRRIEHDNAIDMAREAARIVIEKEHEYTLNKLKGIAV